MTSRDKSEAELGRFAENLNPSPNFRFPRTRTPEPAHMYEGSKK
jgi:hypothetical protein